MLHGAGCHKELFSMSCRALFLPPALRGGQGHLWFNCSNSQQSFPAPSDKNSLKDPDSGALLSAVSTVAEEGQALLSQVLAWPGPTSQRKGKSGRCCRHLPFAVQTRWGMLEDPAPERRVPSEPRAWAGAWRVGPGWSCGPRKVALENWEAPRTSS